LFYFGIHKISLNSMVAAKEFFCQRNTRNIRNKGSFYLNHFVYPGGRHYFVYPGGRHCFVGPLSLSCRWAIYPME
jgi:hypothetical protein